MPKDLNHLLGQLGLEPVPIKEAGAMSGGLARNTTTPTYEKGFKNSNLSSVSLNTNIVLTLK